MSYSHADVAAAFAANKSRASERMSSHPQIPPAPAGRMFTRVCAGISYRTTIALTVVNNHTQLTELWLTPNKYSASTSRHEDAFRSAFIKTYMANHGCDHPTAAKQVYKTHAVDNATSPFGRCEPLHAMNVLNACRGNFLTEVVKPRLRSATRIGALESAHYRLTQALHRMTVDVPLDFPDPSVTYELQDMLAFVAQTQSLYDPARPSSIDDVRAAVSAYIALTDPRNNQ